MLYLTSVALHVLSAIIGFGSIFAVQVVRSRVGDVRVAIAVELELARKVVIPAMTVSLVTGLYQVATGPYAFGDIWIDVTLTILLVLFAIAGAGITRGARRALATTDPQRFAHQASTLATWWRVAAVLVVAAVFLMVLKPG